MKKTSQRKKLIVIVGPTATGKSDMAVFIARTLCTQKNKKKYNINGAEIISADSRQVYRGMDLGTGKITKYEMNGIRHHLLDVVSPKQIFSAGRFQKMGKKIMEEIWKQNKIPIICGGTGFYIQSLIDGIVLPNVKRDKKLRKELLTKSTKELFQILKKIDAKRAKNIDPKNPHRLIRAIEIVKELGRVPKLKNNPIKSNILIFGIKMDKQKIEKRISMRLKKRLKLGMLKEINALHKSGVLWKRLEEFGLEYKYGALFLQKKITKNQFEEKLESEIKKYAKRQITWFKKDKRIVWIKNKRESLKLTKSFFEKFS